MYTAKIGVTGVSFFCKRKLNSFYNIRNLIEFDSLFDVNLHLILI